MDFEDYLPESLPLVTPTYSLEPDMIFGWRPKNLINSGPIPLIFDCDFPDTFNLLINKTNKPIYNGPRPKDSFTIHHHLASSKYSNYPYNFSDPMISAYEFMSRMFDEPEPREFEGMIKHRPYKCLTFDSDFEAGNLDRVLYVNENEYDLYIRSDSNTSRHYHWFYFKVSDIDTKRTVKFNIVNYSRYSPLWDCGQTPVFKSQVRVAKGLAEGWERIDTQVKFLPSRLNKSFGNGPPKYWMLTFSYTFESEETEVCFAATVPYTYTDCIRFIQQVAQHPSVTQESFCKTISGIDLPILTITDNTESEDTRKYMFITSRVHPSETVGSWVMEGFLKFLIGNSPEALELRSLYVFKVIPMLNPDGVILGNSRTSMEGDDINRTYKNPDPRLHPVSYAIRNYIKKMNVRSQVVFFLDMHGHMCKKGSFMYGPYYPLHHDLYLKSRIYPKILGDRTLMFRYFSCRFRIERVKRTAARVVMFKELGVPMSYTLETSYFGYIREDRKTVPYSIEDLQLLGEEVGKGLLDYHKAVEEEALQTEIRAKERAMRKLKMNGGGIEDESSEGSSKPTSAGDSRKRIESLINSIKQDENEINRSDSEDSGSESDSETKRETIRRRRKLIAFMENYAIGVNGKEHSWSPIKKKRKKNSSQSPLKHIPKPTANPRNQKLKYLNSTILESDIDSSFKLAAQKLNSAKPIKTTELTRRSKPLNTTSVLNDTKFRVRSDIITDEVRRRGDMNFRVTVSSDKQTPTVFTEISTKLKSLLPSSEPGSAIKREKSARVRRTDSGSFTSVITPMPKIANVCVMGDSKKNTRENKKRTIREKSFQGVFFGQISPSL